MQVVNFGDDRQILNASKLVSIGAILPKIVTLGFES
jgi:hypothetical protein